MNRETHVRLCESLGVKVPLATRLRGRGLLGPSYSINQIIGRNKFDSFKVKTPFIHTKGRKINFLRASKISFTESLTQLYDQNLILIHSVWRYSAYFLKKDLWKSNAPQWIRTGGDSGKKIITLAIYVPGFLFSLMWEGKEHVLIWVFRWSLFRKLTVDGSNYPSFDMFVQNQYI